MGGSIIRNQAFLVAKSKNTAPLEFLGYVSFLFSRLIRCFVHHFDQMELVKCDLSPMDLFIGL